MVFETTRLVLREFIPSDAQMMFDLNADEHVLRHTGDKPFDSVREAEVFLQQYDAYAKHGFGRWTVLLKPECLSIGWCGLKQHEEGMVDLGFRFLSPYWRQGYATEAAAASLEYGFGSLGLPEIIGRAAKQNLASIRVLEKIGMSFWKTGSFEGVNESVYYRAVRPEEE